MCLLSCITWFPIPAMQEWRWVSILSGDFRKQTLPEWRWCVCMCVFVLCWCLYVWACICVCLCVCVCVCVLVQLCVCMWLCVYVYVYMLVCVYVFACACVCLLKPHFESWTGEQPAPTAGSSWFTFEDHDGSGHVKRLYIWPPESFFTSFLKIHAKNMQFTLLLNHGIQELSPENRILDC